MHATMIDPFTEELMPVLDWLEKRLDVLAAHGADADELTIVAARIPHWRQHGGGAEMQRNLYDRSGDFAQMVKSHA